jgi:RNA polymerase sigma-70 factor (ECF subfamily)
MSSNGSDDSALIDRLRKREPDALAAAYDRYGRVAYSLLLRITHDESTAEDLVQEVFIRLWNRAREFDPGKGALGVWLLSIARHLAIDHLRSAQARFSSRQRSIDYVDPLSFSYNPVNAESRIDDVRTIKSAFEKLNSNQKRVMELAYFEGLSQSEIATRLQEPLGTVKSWVRSALGQLRAAIKGAGTS